ncbi:MAG TPA: flagellar hook-associated protein FlgK [Patescibacteria group bacterium]|nr:flagellar hook-associated protein FlgK [Patescibacteria group bacterium]
MNSTFMGLSISSRGLYSSQAGLAVTSNNISNVETTGYTRQTLNQTSLTPAAVYAGRAIIGAGSTVNSVDQVRSSLVDAKYWRENTSLGEWETKSSLLTQVETIVGDTTDSGFSTVISDFYDAMETLADDASDSSARTNLLETASSLCSYLNTMSTQLTDLQNDIDDAVKTSVEQVNSYAQQIADLNTRIREAAAVGASTNELKDQRALLIDELSGLVEINVTETTTGTNADGSDATELTIYVDGMTLVDNNEYHEMECYTNSEGLYNIRWTDTGEDLDPGSGQLEGYLAVRDGDGTDYKGIPYYIEQLNTFAQTLAKAFNEGVYADGSTASTGGHAAGYSVDGTTTGIRFFTYDDLSTSDFLASGADMDAQYANITAANISISADIQDDVDLIAASSDTTGEENNENIQALITICDDDAMFAKGTPEDFMNSIISSLGTTSAYAQRIYDNKSTVVYNVSATRSSISGVSSNEETAYLTQYQQAYSAAANMISVWSDIYETTIDLLDD